MREEKKTISVYVFGERAFDDRFRAKEAIERDFTALASEPREITSKSDIFMLKRMVELADLYENPDKLLRTFEL